MSCISVGDPQLERLAVAIEQRVGAQRFHVWFHNSTRLDLRADGLEIAVPNDFISEWIGRHFTKSIQEAAHEVLGGPLAVRFTVVPQLFHLEDGPEHPAEARNGESPSAQRRNGNGHGNGHTNGSAAGRVAGANGRAAGPEAPDLRGAAARVGQVIKSLSDAAGALNGNGHANGNGNGHAAPALPHANGLSNGNGHANGNGNGRTSAGVAVTTYVGNGSNGNGSNGRANYSNGNGAGAAGGQAVPMRSRLRHDLETFVVGTGNQLAYNGALYVAEYPGAQYNPMFVHGNCGLGKTHLLQGLCKRFIEHHPTRRWMYLTGEDFTNEFLGALRSNKLDTFRRKVRDLDLLVIDDVHFLGGKKATQEEFLHTFNAIEAMGRQVVMASDNHPKMIEAFGESLINRFVSGMVVRIDPPNFATRCEILRAMSTRGKLGLGEEVISWVAHRVTQNVRELEGAITRIDAHVRLTGRLPDVAMAQDALGDLDRQHGAPVRPECVLRSVCEYFGLEHKDLMSGRRQRTISLARSVAMFLVRKTAKLSFPEIGMRMGKRNHSTVISACRRIEKAVGLNERLIWTSAVGERTEEAAELVQRLEEHSRALS